MELIKKIDSIRKKWVTSHKINIETSRRQHIICLNCFMNKYVIIIYKNNYIIFFWLVNQVYFLIFYIYKHWIWINWLLHFFCHMDKWAFSYWLRFSAINHRWFCCSWIHCIVLTFMFYKCPCVYPICQTYIKKKPVVILIL